MVTNLDCTCVGCGCTDRFACNNTGNEQPCHWIALDRALGIGVCSECPTAMTAYNQRRAALKGEIHADGG